MFPCAHACCRRCAVGMATSTVGLASPPASPPAAGSPTSAAAAAAAVAAAVKQPLNGGGGSMGICPAGCGIFPVSEISPDENRALQARAGARLGATRSHAIFPALPVRCRLALFATRGGSRC